jgi:hypothetical protein
MEWGGVGEGMNDKNQGKVPLVCPICKGADSECDFCGGLGLHLVDKRDAIAIPELLPEECKKCLISPELTDFLVDILSPFYEAIGKWANKVVELLAPHMEVAYQYYIHYIDYPVTTA